VTTDENARVTNFTELGLSEPVQKALIDVGYATPTQIQADTIPHLLAGRDMVGQAQTGTGKTAAFALPLLSKIDMSQRDVQVLVLAPTRELAIQVADSFGKYGAHIKGLKVLPIYGGQDYGIQLRALKRGVQVVVGTPGRVMDHMRRGTLSLDNLSCLVLDEADEMLHMGFIDDVEWVLEQIPSSPQVALFSATMPKPIVRIAKRHLNDPKEIIIESRTTAADSIKQRYLIVPVSKKVDALVRILEMEDTDGVLVFVRTKAATLQVADKLVARGHDAWALNGDLSQAARERTLNQLRNGRLNIIVATDVAARGLDVERISHVINYDAPFDAEAYVHRIGRTGRAGKSGEAILFLTPRDRKTLMNIGGTTRQSIEQMEIPSVARINEKRVKELNDQITETLKSKDISFFRNLIEKYYEENDVAQIEVAAAVSHLLQGNTPILLKEEPQVRKSKPQNAFSDDRPGNKRPRNQRKQRPPSSPEQGMERYRVQVGNAHNVRPGNLVGAIANEANLDSEHIGRISIYDNYSTVDLPAGMPKDTLRLLQKVWVCNTQLDMCPEGFGQPKKVSPSTPLKGKTEKARPEKAKTVKARTVKAETVKAKTVKNKRAKPTVKKSRAKNRKNKKKKIAKAKKTAHKNAA
jgi:ATP-dependent RNA helicase DeaD